MNVLRGNRQHNVLRAPRSDIKEVHSGLISESTR